MIDQDAMRMPVWSGGFTGESPSNQKCCDGSPGSRP